ncbi:GNAT family N-acetyltransferase [Williamsia sp. CHRR-6]|nr:GNAT family N-acetyltransferase [Williamsia sp. CHRR-6]
MTVAIESDPAIADQLAIIAAATFPLACPPGTTKADTDAHIATHLSAQRFQSFLGAPDQDVITARAGGELVGYALMIHAEPSDPEVCAVVTARPVSEVSKMYVAEHVHGGGVAAALMDRGLDTARARGSAVAWLGVSSVNTRAQPFYSKAGFTVVGRKSFWLNGDEQRDYVMSRPLS